MPSFNRKDAGPNPLRPGKLTAKLPVSKTGLRGSNPLQVASLQGRGPAATAAVSKTATLRRFGGSSPSAPANFLRYYVSGR